MKKQSKIISIFLALTLVISCVSTAFVTFAEENYKPEYTEKVTEQDVEALIGDINVILNENLLTGSTIENIYKILPKLSSLLMLEGSSTKASNHGLFYKLSQPERFADLPEGKLTDDVFDENGKLVTPGTLTAFFDEHPILCKNSSDFQKEINTIVKTVLVPNIMDTLQFLPLMSGDFETPAVFASGIDEVCRALGIEQEKSAASLLGFNMMITGETYDIEGANKYINNIVAAILPDTANSVIDIFKTALKAENAPLLYSGLSKIINNLGKMVTGLSSSLSGLGIDITAVQNTIVEIKDKFNALATVGDGESRQFDIQSIVGYLISDLTGNAIAIKFGPNGTANGTVVLEFTEMQLDRIVNAESNADVIKIIYDYLYNNIIGNNQTNSLLNIGLSSGIIENALGMELPADVKDFISGALKMKNDELAYELIVMVADLAGREIPKDSDDSSDPEKPTDPAAPTDPANPSKPNTPGKPSLPNNSANNNNTTETDKSGHKVVKKANIPNTGC